MTDRQQPKRLGRPSIEEVPEGERRAEILRVAGDLFQARGYAAVSLSDIAAGVGVTKATILHHFGSKEGLYAAVMRQSLVLIGAAVRQTAAGVGTTVEKLQTFAYVAIVLVDADADLDGMMRDADEHLSASWQREIAEAHAAILSAVEDVMRAGMARGEIAARDPRLLSHAFWHWLGSFGGRRGAQAAFQGNPEVASTIVDLFLHGATAPAPIPAGVGAPGSIAAGPDPRK